MRAKEFGSWESKDTSKGGFHSYGDGFNREMKGQPYQKYKEYAESGLEEYHKYSETKDLAAEEEEKKKNEDKSSKSKNDSKSKSSKVQNSTSKMVRNLVGRFVAITAGSVILVNTNPVLAERFPFLKVDLVSEEQQSGEHGSNTPGGSGGTTPGGSGENTPGEDEKPDSTTLSANWAWSENKETATLELLDGDGKVVAEIAAAVSVSEEAATCTAEGTKKYTATAEHDGETYSDEATETLPAIGHNWSLTETVELENGQKFTFECANCHEQYSVSTNVQEND